MKPIPTNEATIKIAPNTTLAQIKKQFHDAFPQLKIEFFSNAHPKGSLSHKNELIHNDQQTIQQYIKENTKKTQLNISITNTVWEVEQMFENILHLHTHVFRKMGNTWIATAQTDQWTIDQQINHSLEAETPIKEKIIPIDYTERD